jgi:hypothetical protein
MNRAGVLPRWLSRGVALVGVALVATLVAALPAAAGTVQIDDNSHVLDVTRVQNEAATLPDPVSIYTTTKFVSDNAAFDREAQKDLVGQNAIVIAMNTQSKHLAIRTGPRSRVSQAGAKTATDAFATAFKNNDYTGATLAALGSLRSATQQSRNGGGGSSMFGLIMILVVVLLVVAIIGVVIAGFRRRMSGRQAPAYQDPGYPAPGYGPPGYGPQGYGPQGYGRSGISPMAAGGIGAVAGGVLGYELGKMEGEEHREGHRGDYGDGGGYDGGGYGGGGADADFGGGGSDSGGGGGDF